MDHLNIQPIHWFGSALVVLAATACSGADIPQQAPLAEQVDAEAAAEVESALFDRGSAWVRTPADEGPGDHMGLSCIDCSYNSANGNNTWDSIDVGHYIVTLGNQSPSLDGARLIHITPLGKPGVACAVDRSLTLPVGSTMNVGVQCHDAAGTPTNTRFALNYRTAPRSVLASREALGFVRVRKDTVRAHDSYPNGTGAPTLTKPDTGHYEINFSEMNDPKRGGNAQVTSWTANVHCALQPWATSAVGGTTLDVRCYAPDGTPSDADFSASFTQSNVAGAAEWAYATTTSLDEDHTPDDAGNRSHNNTPIEVVHDGVGLYSLRFDTSEASGIVSALVTPFRSSASCVLLDLEPGAARVACTRKGRLADTRFSFAFMRSRSRFTPRWQQVGDTNLTSVVGVGFGLVCGVQATDRTRVACFRSDESGKPMGPVFAGLEDGSDPLPRPATSIAIDNVSTGSTRVLILTDDGNLYSVFGNLRNPWYARGNFTERTLLAKPRMAGTDDALTLKQVAAIRSITGDNVVLGLTVGGKVVELAGGRFGNAWQDVTSFPIPSEVRIKTISSGALDLYLLAENGSMYLSRRGDAAATRLPALPKNRKPVAMGGPFVATDAGANRDGFVACHEPRDHFGNFDCGDDELSFLMYTSAGKWEAVAQHGPLPASNSRDLVPNDTYPKGMGNPMRNDAFFDPAIFDARMFDGDAGPAFFGWHVLSQLYQWKQ